MLRLVPVPGQQRGDGGVGSRDQIVIIDLARQTAFGCDCPRERVLRLGKTAQIKQRLPPHGRGIASGRFVALCALLDQRRCGISIGQRTVRIDEGACLRLAQQAGDSFGRVDRDRQRPIIIVECRFVIEVVQLQPPQRAKGLSPVDIQAAVIHRQGRERLFQQRPRFLPAAHFPQRHAPAQTNNGQAARILDPLLQRREHRGGGGMIALARGRGGGIENLLHALRRLFLRLRRPCRQHARQRPTP